MHCSSIVAGVSYYSPSRLAKEKQVTRAFSSCWCDHINTFSVEELDSTR